MNREDGHKAERSDCEVKTPRRRFSAKEKLRILEEADACTEPGEIGVLVRREGIYSSYLTRSRREGDGGSDERNRCGTDEHPVYRQEGTREGLEVTAQGLSWAKARRDRGRDGVRAPCA